MRGARYNFIPDMQNPRYALVAYVKSPVGEFVENLRRELHPDLPHLAAHITILPPRFLHGSEASALETLERVCGQSQPFELNLGGVGTFLPDTNTVYIEVTGCASHLCHLHDQLNAEPLACKEDWPYIPHLTIVKMSAQKAAQDALRIARERWASYPGSRRIPVEKLTFVREQLPERWMDLAPVVLGRTLVSR
jgi:2'-5' RNA ligase